MTLKGLLVKDLSVEVAGKLILRDVNLEVRPGEIHAIMGPNASGKSTLAYTIMGHPLYKVVIGDIILDGESILNLPPEERFKRGLFLAFQVPPETMVKTRTLYTYLAKRNNISFTKVLQYIRDIGLSEDILDRFLNKNFSGGEMKRSEFIQMILSSPRYTILDEPDSGVDADGILMISRFLKQLKERDVGVLVITHIGRVFKEINPDAVHVLIEGRILIEGGPEIIKLIDENGYGYLQKLAVKR